jgi:hypothetical protein
MTDQRPLDVYLNDHFAGSTGAVEMAQRAAEEYGSELGTFFIDLKNQIQQDQATLEQMMKQVGTQPSPIKQAGAWVMEKVTRLKLSGQSGAAPELNMLLTLEALELGVGGKLSLWKALKEITDSNAQVAAFDLDGLIARAESQIAGLEAERLKAAKGALSAMPAGVS